MKAGPPIDHDAFRAEALRLCGERVSRTRTFDVTDPYTGRRVGTAPLASADDVRAAFDYAMAYRPRLTRYERSQILERAAALLRERAEEASDLITLESGLSKQDSRYEIGRVADVLKFASVEALRASLALGVALSLGELGATLTVYPPGVATVPIVVIGQVERGYYLPASALSLLMLGASLAALLLIAARVPRGRGAAR